MSMKTDIVYGYGISVRDVSDETLNQFIRNHRDTLVKLDIEDESMKEILDVVEGRADYGLKDIDWVAHPDSGDSTPFRIVAAIMEAETGITFEAFTGDDYTPRPVIMLAQCDVWFYNAKEKAIENEEQIDAILQPYVDELKLNTDHVGCHQREYFG